MGAEGEPSPEQSKGDIETSQSDDVLEKAAQVRTEQENLERKRFEEETLSSETRRLLGKATKRALTALRRKGEEPKYIDIYGQLIDRAETSFGADTFDALESMGESVRIHPEISGRLFNLSEKDLEDLNPIDDKDRKGIKAYGFFQEGVNEMLEKIEE